METQRPLTTGLSPILLGDFVTLDQGTGCVHIAPGHGMEDYILVLEHNAKASPGERLEILAPVDNAGRFTDVGEGICRPACVEGESEDRGVLCSPRTGCWAMDR